MEVKAEMKCSGNMRYAKVTGSPSDLRRVSHQTHEPIKKAEGNNPEHLDVPERKLKWIKLPLILAVIAAACYALTYAPVLAGALK